MRQAPAEIDLFIERLAALRLADVFNPYADINHENDKPNAVEIRQENLRAVLRAAVEGGVDSMWVARDLGYRGGRRTGLALTDEYHIAAHANLFRAKGLLRSTIGPAVGERTASIIWEVLEKIGRPIFLWNVFPLHPHEHGNQYSNRLHTRAERELARPFLIWLLDNLRPKNIVAIGKDAQHALSDLGIENGVVQVRHPSYGGQREFTESMLDLHGLSQSMPADDLFSNA